MQRQARLLAVLVRCISLVGLVGAAFGPAYARLALLLLYGRRWADTEAAPALGWYAQYLPLLAANGILEAFMHAVADERQLHRGNAALVGLAAAHAALEKASTYLGEPHDAADPTRTLRIVSDFLRLLDRALETFTQTVQ